MSQPVTVPLDSIRSVRLEAENSKVRLSLLTFSVVAMSQQLEPQTAFDLACQLQAKAVEAGL
jgi:hypothetical protein